MNSVVYTQIHQCTLIVTDVHSSVDMSEHEYKQWTSLMFTEVH